MPAGALIWQALTLTGQSTSRCRCVCQILQCTCRQRHCVDEVPRLWHAVMRACLGCGSSESWPERLPSHKNGDSEQQCLKHSHDRSPSRQSQSYITFVPYEIHARVSNTSDCQRSFARSRGLENTCRGGNRGFRLPAGRQAVIDGSRKTLPPLSLPS